MSFSLSRLSTEAHLQLFTYSHLLANSVCFDSAARSNYESQDKEKVAGFGSKSCQVLISLNQEISLEKTSCALSLEISVQLVLSKPQTCVI